MSQTKRLSTADRELSAIGQILDALDGLDGDSIQRVLDYVFSRLSIAVPRHIKPTPSASVASSPAAQEMAPTSRTPSIRDLKEEKGPESSNQMAALVAYYLSEVLTDENRKESVNTADLERLFKQAGFKLPKTLSMTLPNATAAGYFDAIGNGLYKLNPVGYNLVVHGLPRSHKPEPQNKNRQRRPSKS
jgi:hypothetical protein